MGTMWTPRNVKHLAAFHAAHRQESIRDRLTVGENRWDGWVVRLWHNGGDTTVVGRFPREDEAWGVVSLILEYVELHGYDDSDACYAAMREYHEAATFDDLAYQEGDAGDLALQDHQWAMQVA